MNPADFRALTHVLPEACLLVTAGGEVVGVNPAAERLAGRGREELEGGRLLDIVADAPDDVRAFLSSASRTRGPVSGALTLSGEREVPCTCMAGLVRPPEGDLPALLLFRLEERASATNRFRLLNDQVDQLTREVRRRRQAEREQARLLEVENATRRERPHGSSGAGRFWRSRSGVRASAAGNGISGRGRSPGPRSSTGSTVSIRTATTSAWSAFRTWSIRTIGSWPRRPSPERWRTGSRSRSSTASSAPTESCASSRDAGARSPTPTGPSSG